jgi:hypothetical protein
MRKLTTWKSTLLFGRIPDVAPDDSFGTRAMATTEACPK